MAEGLDRGVGPEGKATVLIGFMGAGKTTAAHELDPMAVDSDQVIEEREDRKISEIFDSEGENRFREIKERVVLELLERSGGGVVSLGGGAINSEAVRAALAAHRVIWIDVAEEVAWQRVQGSRSDRPLARDREAFAKLHAERSERYASLADAVIPGPGFGTTGRLAESLPALDRLPAGSRLLWASSGSGEYPVFAGPGIAGPEGFGVCGAGESGGPATAAVAAPWPEAGRRFLITDRNVRAVLGCDRPDGAEFVLEPGEQSKNLTAVERALSEMAAAGLTRADHVVAAGGGVVGDLAGFCAAIYQRGIPVVQVPTTVVAQVDSAYGGKTGVDLNLGKNYAGAYHLPSAVIADTGLIESLPSEELAAGFAEVVKTGLLAGGRLWDAVLELDPGSGEALARHPFLIFDCARFKCSVVAADERDGGLRQVLNLGHTVGHAIEGATSYSVYRHGEAVGLGLLAALRLSGAGELRELVSELLARWQLPVSIPAGQVSPEQVVEYTKRDKKRIGDSIPFVLLERPGEPRYGQEVGQAELRAAVEELFA